MRIGMQVKNDSAMPFCVFMHIGSQLDTTMQTFSHPIRKRAGAFSSLAMTSPIMAFLPYAQQEYDPSRPRRKGMEVPIDKNTFVKPIKQCFVRNPRLMPMTRLMLTLISGWAGNGGTIETTTGIIARHIGRCRRQVFRYLKDAVEEGYLSYSRTKDRAGRYTGIRLWLNFSAIRFSRFKKTKTERKTAEPLAMTLKSETNRNHINNKEMDEDLIRTLLRFGETLGYYEKKEVPS